MEFNYYDDDFGSWSYKPTYEELKEAMVDLVVESMKYEIKRTTGQDKFSDSELANFKIIAKLIVDGDEFEWLNDEVALYDELKIYFRDKSTRVEDYE